ncbi:MAG: V-type ATP synthase subunit I [Halodesulfurarchaeum sp.]
MLRPERMSKVSVVGARRVLTDVIEATHDLRVIDFSDYDGHIEGFDQGSTLGGSEDASETLVTIRSLLSVLEVEDADAEEKRIVTDEAVEDQLEDLRTTVNDLDDRRSDLESERQSLEEQIESVKPFVELGIDLDLLRDYESLEVAVGEADPDAVRSALDETDDVEAFEVFGESIVAAFVYPTEDGENVLESALVGVEFDRLEVPDADGDPESHLEDLEAEREAVESDLASVDDELAELRDEYAGFLLAAEEAYAIEVQKREAPLQFATTEHAFVAEGWVPSEDYSSFESTVAEATDGHVAIDQLEVAEYDEYAAADEAHSEAGATDQETSAVESGVGEATGEEETVPDGGENATGSGSTADDASDSEEAVVELESDDDPPVVLDNPDLASPFELLVKVINRPNYWEIDPTVVLLLTFPAFFGFMIGDVGYGLLYTAIGYGIHRRASSDGIKSLGGIAIWAGGFTILFGLLYGEIFGTHQIGRLLWNGHPPMHKGLQPKYLAFAKAWLVLTLLVALAHLTTGFAIGFRNTLSHGWKEAILEKGSWIILMIGVWAWVFSRHAAAAKPDLLFTVFNRPGATLPSGGTVGAEQVAYALGFSGLPESVGIAGLGAVVVGFVLLLLGEGGVGALESLNVLVNVLSYTRIAAEAEAEAGMAFVVNLLFFGAYETPSGALHFYQLGIETAHHGTELFNGLVNMGPLGWLGGIVVLVVGHLLVLALGVTSSGLQAVRLEYVEFFGKFYEGGGDRYEPFGYQRQYTTED